MSECLVPMLDDAWKKPPTDQPPFPAASPLDMLCEELLICLEQRGPMTLHGLIREMEWSAPLVVTALGLLMSQGLVTRAEHDLQVDIKLSVHRA